MKRFGLIAAAVIALRMSPALAAPADGPVDDFSDGTTAGWAQGQGDQVTWQSGGGPDGSSDPYLLVVADGDGAGGRMTVKNSQTRWIGDWLAAGITYVVLDLRNDGSSPLLVRLKLEAGMDASYSAAVTVPADAQWDRYTFGVLPAELQGGDPAAILSGVTTLRIEHNPAGEHPPPALTAVLGIDNVAAHETAETCGNGVLDEGEVCEPGDLAGQTCEDQGFDTGLLACASHCRAFDTSACEIFDDGGGGGGCRAAGSSPVPLGWVLGLLGLLGLLGRARR